MADHLVSEPAAEVLRQAESDPSRDVVLAWLDDTPFTVGAQLALHLGLDGIRAVQAEIWSAEVRLRRQG